MSVRLVAAAVHLCHDPLQLGELFFLGCNQHLRVPDLSAELFVFPFHCFSFLLGGSHHLGHISFEYTHGLHNDASYLVRLFEERGGQRLQLLLDVLFALFCQQSLRTFFCNSGLE